MQLSATSPSQTVLLSGVILLLLGLAGSYLLLLPRLQAANAVLEQADGLLKVDQQNLLAVQKVDAQVKQVNATLVSKGVDLSKAQQILPATEQLPSLYIQMEALVATAQATVGSPTYTLGTPIKDTEGGVQIPVTVSANGDYAHLKLLLGMFEQNIRPVSFTQISFTVATPATTTTAASKTPPKGVVSLSATGFVRALGFSSAYSGPVLNR